MQLGSEIDDSMIEERMNQQRADQCVSVVFSVSMTMCLMYIYHRFRNTDIGPSFYL